MRNNNAAQLDTNIIETDPMVDTTWVCKRFDDISTTTLYRWMKERGFPKGMKVGKGRSGKRLWRMSQIEAFIDRETA